MCKVQMLRALVEQRLTAAAEEIFGLFERTIAEYEEELSRSKEENERQRKLLDAVFNPQLRLHRADIQQVLVVKEEVPSEQQEWSSSLDQEEPEPPHIKEEQEELWTSQEGEQLQGLEEADITKFTFIPVPVKSEDDEEEPQSSQLHQRLTEHMETESDEEDCGGPEPARNSDPDTEDKTGDSYEPETENNDDWKETREHQSGLISLKNYEVIVSDLRCSTREKPFRCSECAKSFGTSGHLKRHMRIHTEEKPFSCSVCMKCFRQRGDLQRHMRTHTGEKPFSCSVCKKSFTQRANLQEHMRMHTGEKRFGCSICHKRFTRRRQVRKHKCLGCQSSQLHQTQTEENRQAEPPASSSIEQMETEAGGEDCGGPEPARNSDPDTHLQPDTDDKIGDCSEPGTDDSDDRKRTRTCSPDEKPFSCSDCGKRFSHSCYLKKHMKIHTGEKPFSCFICKKSFRLNGVLQLHMRIHSGEKPFSCSVCTKSFTQRGDLQRHMRTHTGEKPFSCSVCMKSFTQSANLREHMRIHTGEKRFRCSVCNKRFAQRRQVKKHKCFGCQSSQLHQTQTEENRLAEPLVSSSIKWMKTEADGEDFSGPEPARNSVPDTRLQPDTDDKTGDSFQPETDESDFCKEISGHLSGLNTQKSQ